MQSGGGRVGYGGQGRVPTSMQCMGNGSMHGMKGTRCTELSRVCRGKQVMNVKVGYVWYGRAGQDRVRHVFSVASWERGGRDESVGRSLLRQLACFSPFLAPTSTISRARHFLRDPRSEPCPDVYLVDPERCPTLSKSPRTRPRAAGGRVRAGQRRAGRRGRAVCAKVHAGI